jgi:uncharacterized protein (DUF1800 family)
LEGAIFPPHHTVIADFKMSVLSEQQALRRFGLGPKAGISFGNARDLLERELNGRFVDLNDRTLRSSGVLLDAYQLRRRFIVQARRAKAMADGPVDGTAPSAPDMKPSSFRTMAQPNVIAQTYREEVGARARQARVVEAGFTERLVAFWANHFAVSGYRNNFVRLLAGAYEREAIRPHVLGRFEDMLLAATRHPAMLGYLNNARSVGPNSTAGRRRGLGLNENHAREILELHTLGVDGGYTQADVTALARVLTGWTIERETVSEETDRFVFRRRWHEPGPQTVLGNTYFQPDVRQGESVLRDLAQHPATARHIARKFAAAFVADAPPQELVDRLESSFRRTGGDLADLARTLIRSEEAWSVSPAKLITPQEFLWSASRALNLDLQPQFVIRTLGGLGHDLWAPHSPAGYSFASATWLAPDSLTNRLDLAEHLANLSKVENPIQHAESLIGPSLSANTRTAISRAGSRKQALALLLMSPDFQRR